MPPSSWTTACSSFTILSSSIAPNVAAYHAHGDHQEGDALVKQMTGGHCQLEGPGTVVIEQSVFSRLISDCGHCPVRSKNSCGIAVILQQAAKALAATDPAFGRVLADLDTWE